MEKREMKSSKKMTFSAEWLLIFNKFGCGCDSACLYVCVFAVWRVQRLPACQTVQGWASAAALLRNRHRPRPLSAHHPPVSQRRLTRPQFQLWLSPLQKKSVKTEHPSHNICSSSTLPFPAAICWQPLLTASSSFKRPSVRLVFLAFVQ